MNLPELELLLRSTFCGTFHLQGVLNNLKSCELKQERQQQLLMTVGQRSVDSRQSSVDSRQLTAVGGGRWLALEQSQKRMRSQQTL